METKDNVLNNQSAPAFASVDESAKPAAAAAAQASVVETVVESTDPFAHGFPEWDIVPPQVVVRRR